MGFRFQQINMKISEDNRALAEADMFFLLLNSPHLLSGCPKVQYFSVILSYALLSGNCSSATFE
jgi:hypothetical protein